MGSTASAAEGITFTVNLSKRGDCGTLILSFETTGMEPFPVTVESAPLARPSELVEHLKAIETWPDEVAATAEAMKNTADATKTLKFQTSDSHVLEDSDGTLWDIFCGGDKDVDYSECDEEPLNEFKPLVPHQSKVRIMKDPKECEKKCQRVGNSWTSRIHHMNGNVYTVIQNLPPNRYLVYDPVSHSRQYQQGKIYLPCDAVCAVVEPPLVAMLSSAERDDTGSLVFDFANMAGVSLGTVTAASEPSQDVAWLRSALADVLGMKAHLVQILTPSGKAIDDAETLEALLSIIGGTGA